METNDSEVAMLVHAAYRKFLATWLIYKDEKEEESGSWNEMELPSR